MICAILILSSCSKSNESYQAQDIEIRENKKQTKGNDKLQINGLYEVKEETYMYEFPEKSSKYDKLDKSSVVQVLQEADGGFVWVDFNGNQGYVEVDLLKEI